jgi:hypothetical protein
MAGTLCPGLLASLKARLQAVHGPFYRAKAGQFNFLLLVSDDISIEHLECHL